MTEKMAETIAEEKTEIPEAVETDKTTESKIVE